MSLSPTYPEEWSKKVWEKLVLKLLELKALFT